MPTIATSTDAFFESPHKEFYESPNKERGGPDDVGEGNLPFSYTVLTAIFSAYVYRHGLRPYNGSGFDVVFRRLQTTWSNTDDPGIGGATTYTSGDTINEYDGDTIPFTSGNPLANTSTGGHSLDSDTVVEDSDDEYRRVEVWSNGSNTLTITTLYDLPHTFASAKSKLEAIYAAKIAAFEASATASEHWMYDGAGTIITNTSPGDWASLTSGTGHYAGIDGGVDADLYLRHGLVAERVWITSTPTSQKFFQHEIATNVYSDPATYVSSSSAFVVVQVGDVHLIEPDDGTNNFYTLSYIATTIAPSQPP